MKAYNVIFTTPATGKQKLTITLTITIKAFDSFQAQTKAHEWLINHYYRYNFTIKEVIQK